MCYYVSKGLVFLPTNLFSTHTYYFPTNFIYLQTPVNNFSFLFYHIYDSLINMKARKIKARVTKTGFMGSASRVHKPRKGKGSFRRKKGVDIFA